MDSTKSEGEAREGSHKWLTDRIEHWIVAVMRDGRPLKGPGGSVLTDEDNKPVYGPPTTADIRAAVQWRDKLKAEGVMNDPAMADIRKRAMQTELPKDDPEHG